MLKRIIAPALRRRPFTALALSLSLSPLILASSCPLPPNGGLSLSIETIVANADAPVDLVFAPDGRVFYTEKNSGRIRVIAIGALLDAPFATILVNNRSERGLLGIVLHPDFASTPWLYVYYSRSSTGSISSGVDQIAEHRIVRFDASQNVATSDEQIIVTLPGAGPGIHNGGSIRFGPDGKLYVSIGDLAVTANSQDMSTPVGKILRYNDDGTIPTDNPFGENSPIFASGVRNTFGLAFDAEGRLFGNENGPGNHDEVNQIVAGANYGWPDVQGLADSPSETAFAASHANYRDPLIDKSDGSVGAAGIAVVPGENYGELQRGAIVYGEYRNQRIMRFMLDEEGRAADRGVFFAGLPSQPRGMAIAPDGLLWIATQSSIIRLVPAVE